MKRKSESKKVPDQAGSENAVELTEKIKAAAYRLFEKRGGRHGEDLSDWLEAERTVIKQKYRRGAPCPENR